MENQKELKNSALCALFFFFLFLLLHLLPLAFRFHAACRRLASLPSRPPLGAQAQEAETGAVAAATAAAARAAEEARAAEAATPTPTLEARNALAAERVSPSGRIDLTGCSLCVALLLLLLRALLPCACSALLPRG